MRGDTELTAAGGLYLVPEASRFLRASLDTVRAGEVPGSAPGPRRLLSWVRHGLASPDLTDVRGQDMVLSFQDLISLRLVSLLREAGYPLRHIRTAEDWLRRVTSELRPFATRDVWKGKYRKELFVQLGGELVSASKQGQRAFTFWEEEVELIVEHRRLEFDQQGLANTWQPYEDVALRADVQFGAPCLRGTRIPTAAAAGMMRAGDRIAYVADSYSSG